jgi:hypothetical protein
MTDSPIFSLPRPVSNVQREEIRAALYGNRHVEVDWKHTDAQLLSELARVTCKGSEVFEALKWARRQTIGFWCRRGNVFYFDSDHDAMIFKLKFHGTVDDQTF